MSLAADGSAQADAQGTVEIDLNDETDRLRYRCPNGHSTWERTNNHIWCHSCYRASEQDGSVDPEHYHIVDEVDGEEIPWSAVRVEG